MPTNAARGLGFWVRRYLPAELACTATMIAAGLLAHAWWPSPAIAAGAASLGELLGFYAVLAIVVYREQRTVDRTLLLLGAEFGLAELLDTLVVRPAAMTLAIVLVGDPVWGLAAGKLAADVLFYAIAAGAFTVTDRTGLRTAGVDTVELVETR